MSVLDLLDEKKACETFLLTKEWGFMQTDVATELPEPCNTWCDLVRRLDDLLARKQVRQEVGRLEEIAPEHIPSCRSQMRLAYACLCVIASVYVWQDGEDGVVQELPRQIAVPLSYLGKTLDLPLIGNHPSYVVFNTVKVDPSAPLSLDNLRLVCPPAGGEAMRVFIGITSLMEATNAGNIAAILDMARAIHEIDYSGVANALNQVEVTIRQLKDTLNLFHKHLDASTFYNAVRPVLNGWNSSSRALPNGLVYQGVSSQPIRCTGSSAAQSPIFHCLDALLGVQHEGEPADFFGEMCRYMIPEHRAFIAAVRELNLPKFVDTSSNAEVKLAFQGCIKSLVDFRSEHIKIVAKYIVSQAAKSKNNFESLATQGTGGQNLIPFLRRVRESTANTSHKPADKSE